MCLQASVLLLQPSPSGGAHGSRQHFDADMACVDERQTYGVCTCRILSVLGFGLWLVLGNVLLGPTLSHGADDTGFGLRRDSLAARDSMDGTACVQDGS
jgi:hypothetical protein